MNNVNVPMQSTMFSKCPLVIYLFAWLIKNSIFQTFVSTWAICAMYTWAICAMYTFYNAQCVYVYVYIYICMCVCIYICMCNVYVCVYIYVYVCVCIQRYKWEQV